MYIHTCTTFYHIHTTTGYSRQDFNVNLLGMHSHLHFKGKKLYYCTQKNIPSFKGTPTSLQVTKNTNHVPHVQSAQKILAGLSMPLTSFVYAVGRSNFLLGAICISNFSLLSEKLCCWCQFEVTILSCTLQFLTHMFGWHF
jgi:hypothetical protein